MKASELIALLAQDIATNGDRTVYVIHPLGKPDDLETTSQVEFWDHPEFGPTLQVSV